jgi:HAD superfamily hydrolase (TIGR01549 family)
MIKGILFDKDGTLIEFERTWHSIMTIVFKKIQTDNLMNHEQLEKIKVHCGYMKNGFEQESKIQYLPTSSIIKNWLQLIGETSIVNMENQLYNIFNEASVDYGVTIQLLPGTKEIIPYLSKKYFIGIATADTEASMKHSLENAGLIDYFDYFGSDNGELRGKPDPMMAQEFCDSFDIKRNELLIVGDSVSDFQFALNSNAQFVGIHNQYGVLKQHIDEKNLEIQLVSDLTELVKVMAL